MKALTAARTDAQQDALSRVSLKLVRLYQGSEDDAFIDALRAAGFDTHPAEIALGGWSSFLEADPAFVRRHPKAAALIQSEHNPKIAAVLAHEARGGKGPPPEVKFRLPTMEELEKRCLEHEQFLSRHGSRSRDDHGYLRASTDPTSHVAVDGRDTGLVTPIDFVDQIRIGVGKHRVTFSTSSESVDVDVVVPESQNACVYRSLQR